MKVIVDIGPNGDYAAKLMRGGDVLAYEYAGKAHANAWANGCRAGLRGETVNPYAGDIVGSNGRIALGRRGFRCAWKRGNDAGLRHSQVKS